MSFLWYPRYAPGLLSLIFCVLAGKESKKMWSKFANVTPLNKRNGNEIRPRDAVQTYLQS